MRFDLVCEQELSNLLTSLRRDDNTLRLDEVQAFILAMISGPDLFDVMLWQAEIKGSDSQFSLEESQKISTLTHILEQDMRIQLLAYLPPSLILCQNEYRETDYLTWCNAYLNALEIAKTDWFGDLDPELSILMYPIMALAGRFDDEEIPVSEYKQLCDELPKTLLHIYRHWHQKIEAAEANRSQ